MSKALRVLVGAILIFSMESVVADAHHDHHHGEGLTSPPAELPGESIYHLNSKWTDSNGRRFEIGDLKGKVRIAAMLFTSCPTACPVLIRDMQAIRQQIPETKLNDIEMTVFSLDPKRDSPKALNAFAKKMKLAPGQWKLLTAEHAGDVTELAAALGVRFKKLPSGDFIHSNVVFLISETGKIIARQEGLGAKTDAFLAEVGK